jgi:type I restriction enzyme S subunit
MYGEGQTRGRCAELRFAATTNQAVAGLVTTELPVSLKEVIKFVLWDRYEALRMEASGGVQPNLNLSIVRDIAVPVPPEAEQIEIVDRVRQALTIIASTEARLSGARERVDNLERAALAKAFRGELVAQDPTDEPAALLLQRLRAEAPPNNAPIRSARGPDVAARARSQTTSARRARAPSSTRSAARRS